MPSVVLFRMKILPDGVWVDGVWVSELGQLLLASGSLPFRQNTRFGAGDGMMHGWVAGISLPLQSF